MLNEKEAQELMEKFIELRDKSKQTNNIKDINAFKRHEKLCIEKFKYIVLMRAARYKSFSNYEDLVQEGLEALVKSMKNYNPKRAIFFYWAHRYIDTRIARSANLHTTIRFPLKYAKAISPRRESSLPVMLDSWNTEDEYEKFEVLNLIKKNITKLSQNQQDILKMTFGINSEKEMSLDGVSKKMKMSKGNCNEVLKSAISTIKDVVGNE